MLFAFGLSLVAITLWLLIRRRNEYQLAIAAVGISLLALFSQDFLAFQVTINVLALLCILAFVFLFVRRCFILASHT